MLVETLDTTTLHRLLNLQHDLLTLIAPVPSKKDDPRSIAGDESTLNCAAENAENEDVVN